MLHANTIDEVISELNDLIDECKAQQSPIGYFAALYLRVTEAIRHGVAQGDFEDPDSIERLDVIFANRYFDAINADRAGDKPTKSWQVAFDAAQRDDAIVLQHLLLGMNAHINLDLGIALAQASDGDSLTESKADFEKVNTILAAQVVAVRDELAEIWSLLKVLNRIAGKTEDAILDFSMKEAREFSWEAAEKLVKLTGEELREAIKRTDDDVSEFASVIVDQNILIRALIRLIKALERGSVRERIDILLQGISEWKRRLSHSLHGGTHHG